jgi:signal transduction histidine kinase
MFNGNSSLRAVDYETGQTYDGMLLTGKVILALMQEIPDYFTKPEEDYPMEKRHKILIVDDDPVIVAATRRILESAGYETLGAQDGMEALELTRAQRPDLVLLDVNMPKMNGFEVCRRIKADPPLAETFVIMLSSERADSDSYVDGLNMGADGYIARPIANRELLARVKAMLRIMAAEQALKKYSETLEQMVAERTQELREAQEQLARQEKLAALGQMAGSVAHELRNPLAVIKGAVYYLKLVQPDADDKVKEYLDRIEGETQTAEKIISDLLDFSRIKSVDMQPVAVSDLVRSALERFPAPENVCVTLNLPENLPEIYVDLRQMIQVLGNLVVNACQAMTSTSSVTGVSTSSTTALVETKLTISAALDGDTMKIVVQDTGVGITPENIKKLFEPLFTTKAKGIGLGLAVSKKLTEANGGRIEVESEAGKGSTFTLWLPCYSLPN